MREARFRKLAEQQLEPINGMKSFADWVARKGLRRAAVTNAPRPNAEVMIKGLGLEPFFEVQYHMILHDFGSRPSTHAGLC